MRKPHPCGTNLWEITRVGVDIKLKCINCGKTFIMDWRQGYPIPLQDRETLRQFGV